MLRDDLLNLLNKHRQEAFVTCEESCICWELERIIYEFDQDQQGNLTQREPDLSKAAEISQPSSNQSVVSEPA